MDLKSELLQGLSKLTINSYDFEHELEDSPTTYASCQYYLETENLDVTIELTEEAKWDSFSDFECYGLEITELEIRDEDGLLSIDDLGVTDDEMLNVLNY